MAEAISSKQDLFTCPICLDLLRDPVTIPCGHNYCTGCIKDCWNREDQRGVYSCPQCRQNFFPKPVLNKNNIVAELVEEIRKTRIHVPESAYCCRPTETGDVECDVCTDRKLKAVKSCLDCVLSYCETHFKVHNDINPGRKHKVVNAIGQLQERICVQHEKPLEIFCRTDQDCVCLFCLVDGHKGHDTVSASTGQKEKQVEIQRRFQQRIQEREKELQELREAVETLKSSAQKAVEDSEKIFTEMICSIERKHSKVTELIRAQEKAEVSRAEVLLKRLEQEIAELKRRDAEMEQLSHTEDHIHFLKTFQSVSDLPESTDLSRSFINQSLSFEAVTKSASSLKMQLEDFCEQEVVKISAAVTEVQVILPSKPTTRKELLQYSVHLTLDPNTAHKDLTLSEGNRRVDKRDKAQSYPDHPERFDGCCFQVLCREGVSGRCYWEIERRGEVNVTAAYKSIRRKSVVNEGKFGRNERSWSVILSSSSSYFRHNKIETKLPLVASSRIGVYVDHRAGTLAFYSISDTMTLLYKIQTTFSEPLYPGFGFGADTAASVQLL